MQYIHSKGFIHGDLNPHNMLFGEDGNPKITSFGMSNTAPTCMEITIENNVYLDLLWISRYTAPEIMSGRYTRKIDMYAFGLILWELVHKQSAFSQYSLEDANGVEQFTRDINQGARPSLNCPATIAGLISACWHPDPESRPDWIQIILWLKRSCDEIVG